MDDEDTSVLDRLTLLVGRARRAASAPLVRVVLLVLGLSLFAALAIGAFRAIPLSDGISWTHFAVLVLFTTPLTLALNTAELRLIAETAGVGFGWGSALRTTVVASLANLLPVPGAAAVRTTALIRRGVTVRRAAEANVLAALVWFVLAGVAAGIGSAFARGSGSSAAVVALGALPVMAVVSARVRSRAGHSLMVRLVAAEAATVFVSGLRLHVAARAIGQRLAFDESIVVGFSQVLTALVGFVPGGLGLRELIAGGLGALIGVDANVAVATSVTDRAGAQVGTLLILLALSIAGHRPRRDEEEEESVANDAPERG